MPQRTSLPGAQDRGVYIAAKETALPPPVAAAPRRDPLLLSSGFLLLVALLFGGGSIRFPLAEMLVQLAALPALFFGLRDPRPLPAALRLPARLGLAWLLLIALQLVPLPAFLWQALPGRAELAQAARLIGDPSGWRPWSVDPEMSVRAALATIVPAALLLGAARLDETGRRSLLWLVLLAAAVHLAAGGLQAMTGGKDYYLFRTGHVGFLLGLFANRNHMAEFMLLAVIVAAALLARPDATARSLLSERRALLLGIVLIAVAAIIATSSRTVSALTLPALLALAVPALPRRWHRLPRWAVVALLALALLGLAAALLTSAHFGAINALAERFTQDDDARFVFWPDVARGAWHFFPFGSGLGTFDTAFRMRETLAIVGTHFVNNAHDDYLELAVETGIFGPVLLAALLAWSAGAAPSCGARRRWIARGAPPPARCSAWPLWRCIRSSIIRCARTRSWPSPRCFWRASLR